MSEVDYKDPTKGPWYCDWNWCRIKFTDSKELGKHVMEHIDEDYQAGALSCRKSDADRLRRTLEGLDSMSLNLQDSQSQSRSQPLEQKGIQNVAGRPSASRPDVSPSRARSRSPDSDEEKRRHKRTRQSFADVDAGSSPDADMAPLPDSPDIFAQTQEIGTKHLPLSPSPAAVDLTASPGVCKLKRPWRLPGAPLEFPSLTVKERPSASEKPLSQKEAYLLHEPAIIPAPSITIGSSAQSQLHGENEYGDWVDDIISQAPYNF